MNERKKRNTGACKVLCTQALCNIHVIIFFEKKTNNANIRVIRIFRKKFGLRKYLYKPNIREFRIFLATHLDSDYAKFTVYGLVTIRAHFLCTFGQKSFLYWVSVYAI